MANSILNDITKKILASLESGEDITAEIREAAEQLAKANKYTVQEYLILRAGGAKPKSPRFKFTKARLEKLPIPDDKTYWVFDETVRDLRCTVSTAGTKSLVVVRKAKGGTVPITVTICKLGALDLDEVRSRAREAIGLLLDKINPNEQARAEKESTKITKFSLKSGYTQYVKTKDLAPRTLEGYKLAMTRDLEDWSGKPLLSIDRAMVLERFAKIEKDHGKSPAVRASQVIRAVHRFANDLYYTDENPTPFGLPPTDILNKVKKQWSRPGVRNRKVSAEDLPAFMAAVRKSTMAAYIEFVALTGVRRREAGFLRVEDVDLKKRVMTFRQTKNGSDHTLPITDRVLELLTSRMKGTYIFGDVDPKKAFTRITRESGVTVSTHDLRRSYASFADRSGAGQYAIKAILNHSSGGDVTGEHYAQYDVNDLREPMQRIETYILGLAKAHDARILSVV